VWDRGRGDTIRGVPILGPARFLTLACGLLLACTPGPEAPRHLVLISVDTLRADRLGSYGASLGLTPHLDRLAGRAVRFETVYAAAPFTLPSVAALMTGRYPREIGVTSNVDRVPKGVPRLAEHLAEAGFRTGAVVSNFVLRPAAALDPGFEFYNAEFPQREAMRGAPERTAAATTDAAIEVADALLGDGSGQPIFLWVHYQDPHGPYTPPEALYRESLPAENERPDAARVLPMRKTGVGGVPEYQYVAGQSVAEYRARYGGEVRFMDAEVGRLLDALETRAVLGSAAVIFTADHGESLGEDDYWFAHGELLHEPSVRIPLLIAGPGIPAGVRADVASLVDVLPTVLALFDVPPGLARGRDLLQAGAAERERSALLATFRSASLAPAVGLVKGGFKYLRGQGETPGEQLFALPDEERDLGGQEPGTRLALGIELDARLGHLPLAFTAEPQELSPDDLNALRSLGYLE